MNHCRLLLRRRKSASSLQVSLQDRYDKGNALTIHCCDAVEGARVERKRHSGGHTADNEAPIDRCSHGDHFRSSTKFRRRSPESITSGWSTRRGSFLESLHGGSSFPLCLSNRRAPLPPWIPPSCLLRSLEARPNEVTSSGSNSRRR